MANSSNEDAFNDRNVLSCNKYDSEELRSYASINKKNLEAFYQSANVLCDKITITGDDPWKYLSVLHEQCVAYDAEHCDNVMQTFSMESKAKMSEEHCKVVKELAEGMKEEMEKIIAASSEASLELESFYNKLKAKHEAYMQALHFSKKHLNLYLAIEDVLENINRIKICFFTTKRNDKFSITLAEHKQNETSQWEFIESNPKLPNRQFEALCDRLRATNDILAFIVTVQKIFSRMKSKKLE